MTMIKATAVVVNIYLIFLAAFTYGLQIIITGWELRTQLICLAAFFIFNASSWFNYVIRYYSVICYYIIKHAIWPPKKYNLLKEYEFSGIVLPSDIDIFCHMNNSRYSREADFARFSFFCESGLMERYFETGIAGVMSASTIRFRKSLQLFQRFRIISKVVYWDDDNLYIEHKYLSKYKNIENFVYCSLLVKFRAVNGKTSDFLSVMSSIPEKPILSKDVEAFISWNQASSDSLKSQ